jgi:hypothetical protein
LWSEREYTRAKPQCCNARFAMSTEVWKVMAVAD